MTPFEKTMLILLLLTVLLIWLYYSLPKCPYCGSNDIQITEDWTDTKYCFCKKCRKIFLHIK